MIILTEIVYNFLQRFLPAAERGYCDGHWIFSPPSTL